MIRSPCRYSQKRKMVVESTQEDEISDFERNDTPKKIRMDFHQQCSAEEVEIDCDNPPTAFDSQDTESQEMTCEKRKDSEDHDHEVEVEVEESEDESCPSPSPDRKRRRTLAPLENKINSDIRYEDVCLRTSWQTNFLRKCAELVESRFCGAIGITCVKPFYVQFTTCWQESDAVLRLETSDLPAHRECVAFANVKYDASRDALSTKETEILVRNFFQISSAYSLRHPYLIAGIQTGLETRKEIYDFHNFRTAHQIVEKLCVNIPEKDSRACLVQLRTLLWPQILPCSDIEAEQIIAQLFAGFGPDWNTLSKLTGFDHGTLKTAVAVCHNMDPVTTSSRNWYAIHRQILEACDIDTGLLKIPGTPSRSPSPEYAQSNPCAPLNQQLNGHPDATKPVKLPSFNSVFGRF